MAEAGPVPPLKDYSKDANDRGTASPANGRETAQAERSLAKHPGAPKGGANPDGMSGTSRLPKAVQHLRNMHTEKGNSGDLDKSIQHRLGKA